MIVATYMHTGKPYGTTGNRRAGWAIHKLREVSDPFSNGSRVRYVGWVDGHSRSDLAYAYPEAIEVQTIEVTPRALRRARTTEHECA
jgi:hypothetical protein